MVTKPLAGLHSIKGLPTSGPTKDAVPSESLDLPPSIEALLYSPTPGVAEDALTQVDTSIPPEQTFNLNQPAPVPNAQAGGMIMPQGNVQPPAGLQTGQQPTGPTDPRVLDSQINQSANPEVIARIRAAIEAGLETGELTTQELNMMVELARAVAQNPSMYPQIRQLAIERGIATEQDIPVEYDEGLIIAILMIGKALEADVQFGPSQPTMPQGGELQGPSHAEGGIPVKAGGGLVEMEGGEYMIPKHVVKAKGTEFFDKMIKQYEEGGEVKKDKY